MQDIATLHASADRLRRARQLDRAVAAYAEALLIDPDHEPSLLGLGATLRELGRLEEAARVSRRMPHPLPGAAARSGSRERGEGARHGPAVQPDVEQRRGGTRAPQPGAASETPARPGNGSTGAHVPVGGGDRYPLILPIPARAVRDDPAGVASFAPRARLAGLIAFPLVLSTYVVVGIVTHFSLGLLAAAAVAVTIAGAGSLPFAPRRWSVFKSILRGMAWGVGLVVLAGLVSLVLAITRPPGPHIAGEGGIPLEIVIPLRWLDCRTAEGRAASAAIGLTCPEPSRE